MTHPCSAEVLIGQLLSRASGLDNFQPAGDHPVMDALGHGCRGRLVHAKGFALISLLTVVTCLEVQRWLSFQAFLQPYGSRVHDAFILLYIRSSHILLQVVLASMRICTRPGSVLGIQRSWSSLFSFNKPRHIMGESTMSGMDSQLVSSRRVLDVSTTIRSSRAIQRPSRAHPDSRVDECSSQH